jgi:hypothetical protein
MIKVIYILWFQGFENAPEIVKKCIDSWKYYNSDWTINLLDNNNLGDYINIKDYIDLSKLKIEKSKIANIIRCILLSKYGGVWTDATTFCNKPLSEWLPNYINHGFFAFEKPGPDRLLSNWFLYSEKNNYIIEKWCNYTIQFHKNNFKIRQYFVHHYLFNKLYYTDTKFKDQWDLVSKLPANGLGPHYLQHKGMFNNITDEIKNDINNKVTPFYKLTYKCIFPEYDENIILYYLYSTIKK